MPLPIDANSLTRLSWLEDFFSCVWPEISNCLLCCVILTSGQVLDNSQHKGAGRRPRQVVDTILPPLFVILELECDNVVLHRGAQVPHTRHHSRQVRAAVIVDGMPLQRCRSRDVVVLRSENVTICSGIAGRSSGSGARMRMEAVTLRLHKPAPAVTLTRRHHAQERSHWHAGIMHKSGASNLSGASIMESFMREWVACYTLRMQM
jgi:hypothetical protein